MDPTGAVKRRRAGYAGIDLINISESPMRFVNKSPLTPGLLFGLCAENDITMMKSVITL